MNGPENSRSSGRRPGRSSASGFTLIEVVAAIFLTSIVLTVAIGFFVSLSHSTEAATNRTREGRYAVAALDRLARDLEGAYLLVAPEGEDPFFHEWQFLAESHIDPDGADRVKFVTRNHRPRNSRDHGSDIAVVTYLLRAADEEPGYELVRAVEPGLPQDFDRDFRPADDELFMVVAERIDRFSMRFLNQESPGAGLAGQLGYLPTRGSQLAAGRGRDPALLSRPIDLERSDVGPSEDRDDSFEDFLDDSFGERGLRGLVSAARDPPDAGHRSGRDARGRRRTGRGRIRSDGRRG